MVPVAAFLVTGGKPYYLAGLFPVLLAAGAIETATWLERGRGRWRRRVVGGAIVLSGVASAVIALPVLPARYAAPVFAVNPDAAETIGWLEFARTVAGVYRRSGGGTPVIFTANYGEAGAIDRYGPSLGLPRAYSSHNGYGEWGPRPDRPAPVVVAGLDKRTRDRNFTGCLLAARVSNAAGVDNEENGTAIHLCSGTRRTWSRLWPGLRRLG